MPLSLLEIHYLKIPTLDKGPLQRISFLRGLNKRGACLFQLFSHLSCVAIFAAVLLGCQPSDENVFPYQQRLNSGKPIIYDRPGEIHVGCRSGWTEIRLTTKEIEDLFFIGALAAPAFGDNNCLAIGDVVRIENTDTKEILPDLVRVSRVIIWKGLVEKSCGRSPCEYKDFMNWDPLNFQGSEEEKVRKNDYVNQLFSSNVMNKMNTSDNKVVNISHIHLVGSASDQALAQKGFESYQASLFEETSEDGKTLSSCGSQVFKDFRTTKEVWELINSGRTQTAWTVSSGLLCVPQGSEIDIVSLDQVDGVRETFGRIKIGKMRRMILDNLSSEFLNLTDKSNASEVMNEIEQIYSQTVESDPKARLFLFDFELISERSESE